MDRSDFRGAIRPGHPSLATIFRREKPDARQDDRCTPRQTAAPYRATMKDLPNLRLDSRTTLPTSPPLRNFTLHRVFYRIFRARVLLQNRGCRPAVSK